MARRRQETLTRLGRLAQRRPCAEKWLDRSLDKTNLPRDLDQVLAVVMATGQPLGGLLARAVARSADPDLYEMLLERWDSDSKYPRSVHLQELFRVVMEQATGEPEGMEGSPERAADLASVFGNLAVLKENLGLHAEAMDAAQQALAGFRLLRDGEKGKEFREDLATALSNVGKMFLQEGQLVEALEPTREAIQIRRELLEEDSAAHRLPLVTGLDNLGVILAELGQNEAALGPASEAIELASIPEGDPIERRALGGQARHNFAKSLKALERLDEAVSLQQEVVLCFRDLAALRPDSFEGTLALALLNLCSFLDEHGSTTDAMIAGEESIQILRRLAKERFEAFGADLARVLQKVSPIYRKVGEPTRADQCLNEAIHIWFNRAELGDWASVPPLAEALVLRGELRLSSEDPGPALADFRGALEGLRQADAFAPEAFRPSLISNLMEIGRILSDADLLESSGDLAGCLIKGCRLLIDFAAQNPEYHREQRALPLTEALSELLHGEVDEMLATDFPPLFDNP